MSCWRRYSASTVPHFAVEGPDEETARVGKGDPK
jgi:hypothetical protein